MVKSTAFRAEMRDAWLLFACALFGLTASFTLTLEKIHLLQNPGATPSCSINPFISCASAISSDLAAPFGVPLSLVGIIAYTALLTISVLLLTNHTLSKTIWRLGIIAASAGFAGIHYLIIQSVFVLHVICPWCFGVWLTVPAILVALLGAAPLHYLPGWLVPVAARRFAVLGIWYCLLFLLLLTVFWDAWTTLL